MEVMQLMEDWKGFSSVREVSKPEDWEQRLTEVANLLYGGGIAAHRREFLLREAMTTSDFPYLFGDILDRQTLGIYNTVPATWKQYMLGKKVRDFRTARIFGVSGLDTLLNVVEEKGEYPASTKDEYYYDIAVKKMGRQFDISWETLINDDLSLLDDTPRRFAMAASNTEHHRAVLTYAGDIGTHGAGNLYENAVNSDAVDLTIANLEDAVAQMATFRSRSGMPMVNKPKYLVVPPELEFTARQILTSTHKYQLATGDTDEVLGPFPTANVIGQYGLQLIVEPWLTYIDAGADDEWYLFADQNQVASVAYAHLTGHEKPEICMRSSDKLSIGGGSIGPLAGDFATDNVFYRVRVVFGTARMDWRGTYYGRGA